MVVAAVETPGPGLQGHPQQGRWVRAGGGVGAGSGSRWSGQAGIQEASPKRWAPLRMGPARAVRLPTRRLPARHGAVGFGVNSCRDTGIAQCLGRGSSHAQLSPAQALSLSGFHRCSWAQQPCPSPQPRWSPPVLPGPAFGLSAAGHGSPYLPPALPSGKATQCPGKPCPPWRWACQVGTCIAVLDTCQHLRGAFLEA